MKLASSLNCNGHKVIAVPDPTNNSDVANKSYVDNALVALGINLNGNKHYRGSTVPINPSTNDTWDEETSAGVWVRTWVWNGSYWLSTQEFWKDSSIVTLNASSTIYYDLPIDANVYVSNFKVSMLLGATNTALAYWTFALSRATAATQNVALGSSLSTSGASANAWYTSASAINSHINIASSGSKAFRVDVTRVSTPSSIAGAIEVSYRLAKI